MKKRLYALLLVAMLCLQCFSVAAYVPYTPGDITYPMSFDDPLNLNGASVTEDGKLVLEAGGLAEFDMLFLLDVASVEVNYKAEAAGKLTMNIEENTYEIPLSAEETAVNAKVIDRQGSHVVKLSSDCKVEISSIVFTKVNKNRGDKNNIIVELDDYDKALQSTIVVKQNSVALKVNGAMRYIDYDDITLTPMTLDGRVYLPIHTAARALSLYYEDYSDLSYVYLSDDNAELYAGENGSYTVKNGVKKDLGSFAVYKDGTTWVPLRQMAELFDKTVAFKDGFVIIDDRICVKNIINDDSVMEGLKAEFAEFDASLLSTGNVYHVSTAAYAKDTNDGSESFPFRTIQKAADVAKAGDTVIIHEGVYRETVTPKNDGTATAPIVFKAAEGEDVTISAFEEVSGFEHYKGDIYQTFIPKSMGYDRNFIIMNDEIIREGRHPNTDTTTSGPGPHPDYDDVNVLRATMGDMRIHGTSSALVQTAQSEIDLNQEEKDYWKGGTFVTFAGEAWTLSYAKIIGSEYGKMSVQGFDPAVYGINKYYTKKQLSDYGYITNHINTVDLPGEWFIEGTRLYMIPPAGTDPKTLTVEVKQRQRVIDLTDRKFVQFVDINTRGGGLTMAGDSEMCVLNGGTHKYISHVGYSTGMDTHRCRFYDYVNSATNKEDAPEWGEVGFFSHGINNAFINADISYSAAAGIYCTGSYTYIENNVLSHTSYAGTYPSGITIEGVRWDEPTAKCGGHTVIGNTSWGAGRGAFYLSRNFTTKDANGVQHCYPVLACDVSYNHFYLGSVTARDSGVTYTHGTTFGNDWIKTKIHHNVAHDCGTHKVDNYMANIFYYDGQSVLSESYSNLAFSTYEDYLTNLDSNYQISNGGTAASSGQTDFWGNVTLGVFPEGFEGLEGYHYPYQKPFDVGAVREGDERFMLNYNKYSLENTKLACEGELRGGAYIDNDGFVRFPTEEASVTLDNVQFHDEGSYIQLTCATDKYKYDGETIPNIIIEIEQNGQTVSKIANPVGYNHKSALDGQATIKLYLPGSFAGMNKVKISSSVDFVRFSKIRVNPCNFEEENAKLLVPSDASYVHIGTADEVIMKNTRQPNFKESFAEANVEKNLISYITNSGAHTYVYKNREITNDSSKLSFRLGSGRQWANVKLRIHLGSEDGEVISEIDVYQYFKDYEHASAWKTHVVTVDLNRVLPAGTYDFYVENKPYQTERDDQESIYYAITDQFYMAFHN